MSKAQAVSWPPYALLLVVLIAALVRHSAFELRDPYKCTAALSSGSWLDPPGLNLNQAHFQKWQPSGCTTRAYNSKKAAKCLSKAGEDENVFIGDSTVREVFWAMARQLNPKSAMEAASKGEKHANLEFVEGQTSLNFIWDPYLNSSQATQYVSKSRANAESDSLTQDTGLVVLGAGLWFAKDIREPVLAFKDAIDALTDHLPMSDPTSLGTHRPLVMPVMPPFYDKMDASHKGLTPDKIEPMNEYLEEIAVMHDVDVLSGFVQMVKGMPSSYYEPRGIHVLPQIADRQAELILNLRCNDAEDHYTFDGTCCFTYKTDWGQILMLVGGVGLLCVVFWFEFQTWASSSAHTFLNDIQKRQPALWPTLVLFACLFYCYLCDRTHLFDKAHKFYNAQDFWMFIAGIAFVGFTTIHKSVVPSKAGQEKPPAQDQPFLSRDQTDEWKGWMQLLILAYHYVGGSKVLWIYKIIRLLVASYLFMTGYGHAAYFYQKNDFSLKRVTGVMIRLNLLSCLLPWFMGTDYLFYYFAPLVTYWYFVVYITMRIRSDWNHNLPLFLAKTAVACVCTSIFHTQPWLLDPLFKVINAVFGAQWDAKEWFFRCALDQFIVYIGMIVSVLYIRSSKPPPPPAPPQGSISLSATHTKPGSTPQLEQGLYFAASAAALVIYYFASGTQQTKTSSNALHTFISPLPILAFVHLRNCSRTMRNHYSAAFAWIGKISLETFVLQFHIWLAGDTKTLLSLGWFGNGAMGEQLGPLGRGMGLARWLDCIVLGTVFIWLSLKVANATGGFTAAAMKLLF